MPTRNIIKNTFKTLMLCSLVFLQFAAAGEFDKIVPKDWKHSAKKKNGRSLASIDQPEYAAGQGEMMARMNLGGPQKLYHPSVQNTKAYMIGVCRDKNGLQYQSYNKNYTDCMDPLKTGSGYNDYFNSAQRGGALGLVISP